MGGYEESAGKDLRYIQIVMAIQRSHFMTAAMQ